MKIINTLRKRKKQSPIRKANPHDVSVSITVTFKIPVHSENCGIYGNTVQSFYEVGIQVFVLARKHRKTGKFTSSESRSFLGCEIVYSWKINGLNEVI